MQELTDIRELKKRQYLMYIIIMLVLFAVMLTYTIIWSSDYNKRYGFFVKTEAVVIEHSMDNGKLYDVLEYEVDGVVILNTTAYLSQNNIGDKVTIYYDEKNPSGFVTKLDARRVALPVITSIYGVVSMVLTIMFYTNYYMDNSSMHNTKKVTEKAVDNEKIDTKEKVKKAQTKTHKNSKKDSK